MKLQLVFPTVEYQTEWYDIIKEMKNAGERITPYSLQADTESYDEYLDRTNQVSKGINLNGMVPADTFFLVKAGEKRILGAINIRYELNPYLFNYGGNIGYGIRPTERKKGYATEMLKLALEHCREKGMDKVLITCNKNNIASANTMIKNGGRLENEVWDNDQFVQRYWIELTQNPA
ncbi:MAG: GNAT family N-acetyltransferase [Gorillibacterium sp.]|nr:GNAT family N-acetyltransferase [Gorillibacterium sp.]